MTDADKQLGLDICERWPVDLADVQKIIEFVRERSEATQAGMVLVPLEPTAEMIDAGGNTPKMKILDGYCSTAQLRGGFTEDRLAGPKSDCAVAQCWKAMIACFTSQENP